MKILVVPKWYPWPGRPVFGLFCREHARAISTEHEVAVMPSLATPKPGFLLFRIEDEVEDGMRTLRVRYRRPRIRALAMVCQTLGMLAALRRLRGDGFRPDVVHAHVFSAGLPALVLARMSRAALVITEHYTGFQRGLIEGSDRFTAIQAFKRADLVAPVSEDLARHIRALAPAGRLEVHPNVVDTEVFRATRHGAHGGPRRLLTVGALAEKKGHRFLIDALTELDGVELDLVGDGELRAELEAQAQAAGAPVRFHGEIAKERVARLMGDADLFVLPSLFETFGCVLIEAMASGLPSVATRVGGVPEVLTAEAGELVEPGDPHALAEGIERALARSFDPDELAHAARQRYGYNAFARRWTEVYERLRPSSGGSTRSATAARKASSE